jgi:hypothetical protein
VSSTGLSRTAGELADRARGMSTAQTRQAAVFHGGKDFVFMSISFHNTFYKYIMPKSLLYTILVYKKALFQLQ